STDPSAIAYFWQEALGWRRTHDTADEVVLEPPETSPEEGLVPDLLFLRVPEDKRTKNRLHLDLRPDDQDAEVRRLEELGAAQVEIGQSRAAEPPSWVVMADPDGNEFCVLKSLAGR
ncbi:MAG TPA: VOC family protein, partial [Nocardioidaceae bacterium]|nr:VOC family protein [Nocardioidaceae bacterium]